MESQVNFLLIICLLAYGFIRYILYTSPDVTIRQLVCSFVEKYIGKRMKTFLNVKQSRWRMKCNNYCITLTLGKSIPMLEK